MSKFQTKLFSILSPFPAKSLYHSTLPSTLDISFHCCKADRWKWYFTILLICSSLLSLEIKHFLTFIHSCSGYLLSANYVTGTTLDIKCLLAFCIFCVVTCLSFGHFSTETLFFSYWSVRISYIIMISILSRRQQYFKIKVICI